MGIVLRRGESVLNRFFKADGMTLYQRNTRAVIIDVLVALIPAWIASIWLFGYEAFAVQAVCVAAALGSEYLIGYWMKRPRTVGDLSSVVTGLLLSFALPANLPLWQAVIGSVAAIASAKHLLGGFGKNFLNPALFGYIVLWILFPDTMTRFPTPLAWMGQVDAVGGAEPLVILMGNPAVKFDALQLVFGVYGGGMGATCLPALLLGGVYLCWRRVVHPVLPLVYVGTTFVLTWLSGADPVVHTLCGGLLLGAVFMATDPATCPASVFGKVLFALGCGGFTVLMRRFGSVSGGVALAILGMNVLTPYIDQLAVWLSKITEKQADEREEVTAEK